MIRKTLLPLLVCFLIMASTASLANAGFLPTLEREDFWTCDHFSTSLWGLHDTLEEKYGLSFEIVYLQDMLWNTHGGLNTRHSGEYPRLLGLYLELDTGKAGLWENGTFFLSLEHHSGHSPSERQVGDYQLISNIDSKRFNQVSEFWYKHTFLDDKLWLKLGKMDANVDFSYIEYAAEFLHSSAGLIPTLPMPAYPDPDWGAMAGVKPADWFECKFGIYQGKIDGNRSIGQTLGDLRGPMLIFEPSFKYSLAGLPGSVNIGAWWNGRRFEAYHNHPSNQDYYGKSSGLYGFWQQLLWKENPDKEDCDQGIALFAQYGWAPKNRSEVADYVGGGLRWHGAIPTRDDDVMGLGVFHAYFSNQAGFEEHSETAFELFYKVQLTGWMSIQPDVQYVANPGGSTNRDAIVVGGRVEFVF